MSEAWMPEDEAELLDAMIERRLAAQGKTFLFRFSPCSHLMFQFV